MPITTLINYLRPNYYIGAIHDQEAFNLYDRDSHGNNRHPYHIYVRFSPANSTIFFSVYYERTNWETEYLNAKNRSDIIQRDMHNNPSWANICNALNVNANWFGEWNQTRAHGDCKFTFAHDNVPPNESQLKEIKNLIDLIFTCF